MNERRWTVLTLIFLLLGLGLSACMGADAPSPTSSEAPPPAEATEAPTNIPTATDMPTEALEPTQTPTIATEETTEQVLTSPLPPDPIPQTFQASDGVELSGRLYPAAEINAPLIVLFHWAPGDQSAWDAIAPWLQNRVDLAELPENDLPWLDPSWFPPMPDGVSYNVFTFTFRGCEGGCRSFDREGWLLDAEGVMTHVSGLENVDISRVAAVGASIGADGAAIGCHAYNMMDGVCLGAISLSPGGYLTRPYPEEVADLGAEAPPKPAWCLYSVGDAESAAACEAAEGENFQAISYDGGAHGLAIVEPNREPDPLGLLLDFLKKIGL